MAELPIFEGNLGSTFESTEEKQQRILQAALDKRERITNKKAELIPEPVIPQGELETGIAELIANGNTPEDINTTLDNLGFSDNAIKQSIQDALAKVSNPSFTPEELTQDETELLTAYDNLVKAQLAPTAASEREEREKTSILTDKQLESTTGQIANLAIGFGAKTVELVGKVFSAGEKARKESFLKNISEEDITNYHSAVRKNEIRKRAEEKLQGLLEAEPSAARDQFIIDTQAEISANELTDEEAALFKVTTKRTNKGNVLRFDPKADQIKIIEDIAPRLERFQNTTDKAIAKINDRFSSEALNTVKDKAEDAAVAWESGSYLESVSTVIGAAADLATKDTAGALQLLSEQLPLMLGLAYALPVVAPSEITSLYGKAVQAHIKEYGEEPTAREREVIKLLSILNVGADRLGAKLALGAGKHVNDIIQATEKLNIKLPTVLTNSLKVTAPIQAATLEGSTEAFQSVLESIAGSIRDPKIGAVGALTEGIVGAAIGGGISLPSTLLESLSGTAGLAKEVTNTAKAGIDKVAASVKAKAFVKTETLIADKPDSIETAEAILRDGLTGLDENQRKERLKLANKIIAEAKGVPDKKQAELAVKAKELILAHLELTKKEKEGATTLEQIKIITEDTSAGSKEEQEKQDATIKSFGSSLLTRLDVSPAAIQAVQESSAFARASEETKTQINEYAAVLKSMSKVSEEILTKGEGKFKSLAEHLVDLNAAIGLDNVSLANDTINALDNFSNNQSAKLEAFTEAKEEFEATGKEVSFTFNGKDRTYSAETKKLYNAIKSDLKAIDATLAKAKDIVTNKFGADALAQPVAAPVKATTLTSPTVNTNVPATPVTDVQKPTEATSTTGTFKQLTTTLRAQPTVDSVTEQKQALDRAQELRLPNATEATKAKLIKALDNIENLSQDDLTLLQGELSKFGLRKEATASSELDALATRIKSEPQPEAVTPTEPSVETEVEVTPEPTTKPEVVTPVTEEIETTPEIAEEDTSDAISQEQETVVAATQVVITEDAETDVVGLRGNPAKNLTDNLLIAGGTNSKVFSNKVKGEKGKGKTVVDVFVSKAKVPDKLFNIVHNFFSLFNVKGFTRAMRTKVGKLSKEELNTLQKLSEFHKTFSDTFLKTAKHLANKNPSSFNDGIFPANPETNTQSSLDQDPLTYFIKIDSKGNRYLNENLIGLMSTVAYNWLATGATKTLFNDSKTINRLLGRDTKTDVTDSERDLLQDVGTPRTSLAEQLGKKVVKQLGLKVNEGQDGRLIDKLSLAIGLHIIATLTKQGYLTNSKVSNEALNTIRGEDTSDIVVESGRDTTFTRLAPKSDEDFYEPSDAVASIIETVKHTELFDRLFGITGHDVLPAVSPIKYVPKFLKGTTQSIPKSIRNTLARLQQVEWEFNKDSFELVDNLTESELLNLLGYKIDVELSSHIERIKSQKAINEGIKRDVRNLLKARVDLGNQVGSNGSIYFPYEVWQNMRIGMVGSLLNPQASKITRHFVSPKSWTTKVLLGINHHTETNFKLAVAQAFGYKIDKKSIDSSLKAFDDIVNANITKTAIQAIKDLNAGIKGEARTQALAAIKVLTDREGAHTLQALIELTKYDPTASEFTTNLALEIDGVTNGVAISLLQAPLEDNAKELLASVGFFIDAAGNIYTSYPEWADIVGHRDLYQRLSFTWSNILSALKSGKEINIPSEVLELDPDIGEKLGAKTTEIINEVEKLLGAFVVNDEVTKIGRNLAKNPLMITSYGAAIKAVIRGLSGTFLEEVYKKLEKANAAKDIAKVKEIVASVYKIAGVRLPRDIDYANPLEISFRPIASRLNKSIQDTYGAALGIALSLQFKQFFRFREHINHALNVMYVNFNIRYEAAIKEATNAKGTKLTPEKKQEIFNSLKEFLPTFKTHSSQSVDDSLLAIKTAKRRNYDDYTEQVQISLTQGSISGYPSEIIYQEPGVAGLVMGTHAQDLHTAQSVLDNFDVLHVHDAAFFSMDTADSGAFTYNESFFNEMQDYSILDSVIESYSRTMKLLKEDTSSLKSEIGKEIRNYLDGIKDFTSEEGITSFRKFNESLIALQKEVTKARSDIFSNPNIIVNQYASRAEGSFTKLEEDTTDFFGESLSKTIDNLFNEAITEDTKSEVIDANLVQTFKDAETNLNQDDSLNAKGSSANLIDFDNFTGQLNETLTADNSLTIFDSLETFGNKQEDVFHREHLREVLTNLVNKVLVGLDSVEFKLRKDGDTTYGGAKGEKVYINASTANRLFNNNEMSTQETFVHELLHNTLGYAIDHNANIRNELKKLFNEVSKHITWRDFLPSPELSIDPVAEENAAKARYDYIFNNKESVLTRTVDRESRLIIEGKTNNYLHEFVSFGLTNAKFIELLSKIDTKPTRTNPTGTLKGWLTQLYNKALDWITGTIYQTKNLKADVALRNLADQLGAINNRERNALLKSYEKYKALNGVITNQVITKIIAPLTQWRINARSNPQSTVGKVLNIAVGLPITLRVKELRKRIKQVLRNLGLVEETMIIKLVRELQGNKESNAKWHVLLRHSKNIVDRARKHISNEIVKQVRSSFITPVSENESKAITRILYKLDMHSLVDTYSITQIIELLRDTNKVASEITSIQNQLNVYGNNGNYYINQARGLGKLMALGKTNVDDQKFNAYMIANLFETGATPTGDLVKAEELIDQLATLYGLLESTVSSKKLVADVIEREFTGNSEDNGIITTLNLIKGFKEDSLERLFKGNKALTVKGYIHEKFASYTDVKFALISEQDSLKKAGYVLFSKLPKDSSDPRGEDLWMYVTKNNVSITYLKSIVSLTNKTAKGSDLVDGYTHIGAGVPTDEANKALDTIKKRKRALVARQFRSPNVSSNNTQLVPIFNERGQIKGYRYLMNEHLKQTILERDDRFDLVLGNMYGSIKDKVSSKDVNRQVVKLAYEDYKEGFSDDPDGFVTIDVNSPDPRYQELYQLLPEDMRRDMKEIWGSRQIVVRRELVDLIFGYRKASIANLFKDSNLQSLRSVNKLLNHTFVRQTEAIWQEIVQQAKVNIVIRNPIVLLGNFISNAAISWVKGMPHTYMAKNQALALRELTNYQRDLSERDLIERKLKLFKLTTDQRNTLEVKLARLNDDLTNNPIRDLIDEGIFQSITEDIDDVASIHTYQDRLLRKFSGVINRTPEFLKKTYAQANMNEDTTAFKALMKATQYSDFIARFALHKYNTEVKKISKEESLKDIVETFVNYDIPTSKQLQYLNDIGLFMFSKFLFRIQKVIFKIIKEHPAKTLALLVLQNAFGNISDVMDSNLITGSLVGRVHLFDEPFDSATELSGLNIASEVLGF